jgi:hypothetical protein
LERTRNISKFQKEFVMPNRSFCCCCCCFCNNPANQIKQNGRKALPVVATPGISTPLFGEQFLFGWHNVLALLLTVFIPAGALPFH